MIHITSVNAKLSPSTVDDVDIKSSAVVTSFPNVYDDPWKFGFELVTKMDAISSKEAFTVIVATSDLKYYGYGCVMAIGEEYQFKDFLLSKNTPTAIKELFYVIIRMR